MSSGNDDKRSGFGLVVSDLPSVLDQIPGLSLEPLDVGEIRRDIGCVLKNAIRVGKALNSNTNLNLNLNDHNSRALVVGGLTSCNGPRLGISKTKCIWRPKQDGLDSLGFVGSRKGSLGNQGQNVIKRAYKEEVDDFFDSTCVAKPKDAGKGKEVLSKGCRCGIIRRGNY